MYLRVSEFYNFWQIKLFLAQCAQLVNEAANGFFTTEFNFPDLLGWVNNTIINDIYCRNDSVELQRFPNKRA